MNRWPCPLTQTTCQRSCLSVFPDIWDFWSPRTLECCALAAAALLEDDSRFSHGEWWWSEGFTYSHRYNMLLQMRSLFCLAIIAVATSRLTWMLNGQWLYIWVKNWKNIYNWDPSQLTLAYYTRTKTRETLQSKVFQCQSATVICVQYF